MFFLRSAFFFHYTGPNVLRNWRFGVQAALLAARDFVFRWRVWCCSTDTLYRHVALGCTALPFYFSAWPGAAGIGVSGALAQA